ncbi:heavy metal translocating P-type ATPase [Azospirillum sp. sgz301742]
MQEHTVERATRAAEQTLRYRVTGMDCASCVAKVETALRRVPGADDISLNFHTQVLKLKLDETATPRPKLEDTIRSLGFEVATLEDPRVIAGGAGLGGDGAPIPGERPWSWGTPRGRSAALIGVLVAAGYLASWLIPLAQLYALLPAALVGLAMFGRRAVALARAGSPFSIEMLMSVATGGALLIGETPEAAVVVLLFAVGELLEGVAASHARSGIAALGALVPRTALLLEGDVAREVPASRLEIGQIVLVRPGERVPADGEVMDGESDVDESPVTGESVSVLKRVGSAVFAGGINTTAALQVRVTRAAADNTIARIIHLVEEAQASKSPTARFIERFSARYTPAAIGFSALVMVVPPLALGADWHTWIYRGLALLLIACPCALVLSTPAAVASGLATGARRGLLVKGGATLEAIGRVRTVAFDKTGTLTRGRPQVTDIVPASGSERTLLGLAASVENGSTHPIAAAMLERAAAAGVPPRPARDHKAIPGRAVQAVVGGKLVEVGSPRHYAERCGPEHTLADRIATLEDAGKTVAVVIVDGQPIGLVAVRDEPRADALDGVAALHRLGLGTVMLTGDNRRTSEAIARTIALNVKADLLPEDKLREIAAMREQGSVAMVGDGINDAPALAAADVGIAMGGGTDVALETADAALLRGRVADVAALVALSQATLANIHQNVTIALGLKAVFLATTVTGVTDLWAAILADTGATVIVTMNALRLLGHYRGTRE